MEQLSEVFIWLITHCTANKFALLLLDWVILVVFILRTCIRLDELRQTFCSSSGSASQVKRLAQDALFAKRTTFRSASFKTYFEGNFVQMHNASCARVCT